jgi:CheY-like chemotaxis protein
MTSTHCNSILIVEDEDSIREALKLVLEYEGYQVREASNGKEALEILPSMPKPCMILLDLMMPIMDGWKFTEVLAADVMLAAIPVVVVSAFTDKVKTVKCNEFVKKPVNLDLLIPIVHRYCSGGPRNGNEQAS